MATVPSYLESDIISASGSSSASTIFSPHSTASNMKARTKNSISKDRDSDRDREREREREQKRVRLGSKAFEPSFAPLSKSKPLSDITSNINNSNHSNNSATSGNELNRGSAVFSRDSTFTSPISSSLQFAPTEQLNIAVNAKQESDPINVKMEGRRKSAPESGSILHHGGIEPNALISDISEKEKKQSFSAFPAVLPLILGLLPAITSVLISESAGIFVTDVLLLSVVGWILWGINEGTWKFYMKTQVAAAQTQINIATNNVAGSSDDSGQDQKDRQGVSGTRAPANISQNIGYMDITVSNHHVSSTIALFLFLISPLVGGAILHVSRQNLSSGSRLLSDFNIFLYVALELARGINRLGSENLGASIAAAAAESEQATVDWPSNKKQSSSKLVQEFSSQVDKLQTTLGGLETRILQSETIWESELRTVWKGVEQMANDMSLQSAKIEAAISSRRRKSKVTIEDASSVQKEKSHAKKTTEGSDKLGNGKMTRSKSASTGSVIDESSQINTDPVSRTHHTKVKRMAPDIEYAIERASEKRNRLPDIYQNNRSDTASPSNGTLILRVISWGIFVPLKLSYKVVVLPLRLSMWVASVPSKLLRIVFTE